MRRHASGAVNGRGHALTAITAAAAPLRCFSRTPCPGASRRPGLTR